MASRPSRPPARRRAAPAAFLAMASIAAVAGACGGDAEEDWVSPLPFDTAEVVVLSGGDSLPLLVEVAESDQERAFGLSRRPDLDPQSGMIFLFDSLRAPQEGFWMWRTRVPLDIAYVDTAGVIVSVTSMEPCADALYPEACPTYAAEGEYVWALETNRGWFEEHGVGPGDTVLFRP